MDQTIANKLYDYQVPHVEALSAAYDANPVIIEPSDTGLGKTSAICALAAIKRVSIFAICPVSVIPIWFDTAEKFGVTVIGVANYEIAKLGKYFPTKDAYLRGKPILCPWIPHIKSTIDANGVITPAILWTDNPYPAEFPKDTLVVFDEAHRGKNNRTMTAQLLMSLRGAIVPKTHTHNQHIALVSATITDRDEDFRVTACVLGIAQHERHAYKSWVLSLAKKYPGESFASCVHKILFPKYGSRMRKDVIAQALDPVKDTTRFDVHFHIFKWMRACEGADAGYDSYAHMDIFSQVMCMYNNTSMFRKSNIYAKVYDVSPETEADIMAAHEEIGAAIEALKRKQAGELCPLTIILRARQRLEMLKLPTMIEQAAEWISNGFAVVLFVNFSHSIETLCKELDTVLRDDSLIDCDSNGNEIRPPTAISIICGGQSATERVQNIRQFQCGESIVAVVNGQSGGTGVSLHHIMRCARPRKSLISPPWSGIMLKQELGRIDRVGALSDSEQVIVYCRGKVSTVQPIVAVVNANNNATPNGADGTFIDGAKRVSIEEIMAAAINKKLKTIDMINNGDLQGTINL